MACQNCGHESHCGKPLWKSVDFREPDNIIKVCEHCRCNECKEEKIDVGND